MTPDRLERLADDLHAFGVEHGDTTNRTMIACVIDDVRRTAAAERDAFDAEMLACYSEAADR